MAGQITGKIQADFTAFQTAVQQAEVSLKGMETGASKVQTSLNRMVDSLGGRKLVQEATLAAEAVERIGGVSKLTEAELQKLGGQALEASNKLKAMGQEVPPGIQRIVDASSKIKPALDSAQSSATSFMGTIQKAAATFGIAFSVGALTRFVGSVLDTASAIGDLSQQLGISAEAVQRFKYAAEQSGSSIDAVGTSIQFMNKTLGAGDTSTKALLADIGLRFQDIRSMSPEDAFVAVSDALGGMTDKAKQAEAGTKLLGRGFAELLPAMEDGITKVGAQTSVMTDKTIADLKRAQDAWSALGTWVTTVSGTIIANTMSTVQSVTSSWTDFAMFVANVVETKSIGAALALSDIAAKARELKPALDAATDKSHALGQAELAEKTREATKALDAQKEAAKKLKDEWDAYITAALKRGDEVIKFLKNYDKAMVTVDDTMGKFVTGHLRELGDRGQAILKANADEAVKFGLAFSQGMAAGKTTIEGLTGAVIHFKDAGIKPIPPEIVKVKFSLDDLSKAMAQLATVAGGSFGAIASGFATIISGANAAKMAIQQIKDASKATDKFEGILGMSTGIMGIVTAALAAVNAIKGIWGAINQREGRHAVEDFADSFGGFDALHAKLLELGDAGEQLWIKLTQGVPAGNADAAARVIAEIEAALASQKTAVDEVTEATEEQAQATIETASQAAKALEELGPKIDINKDEWKSWGDLVTAQIQRIADGLRAMPMPSAMAIAGGNGGIHGGMGPIMNGDVVVRSNLYIDGYVAAESVSRQVVG